MNKILRFGAGLMLVAGLAGMMAMYQSSVQCSGDDAEQASLSDEARRDRGSGRRAMRG